MLLYPHIHGFFLNPLLHITDIDRVQDYCGNCAVIPKDIRISSVLRQPFLIFVTHRGSDPLLVQHPCNSPVAHACRLALKYPCYNGAGFLIYNELVLILRAFPVPIRRPAPYEFSLPLFDVNSGGDFLRHILCVCFIDQVFQRNNKAVIRRTGCSAVIAIRHCDKPDSEKGEDLFKVIPCFKVVPAKP